MTKQATVAVDCSRISEHTINPYIFGHFVEDIRDHMDAMLAFPLKDMDFESESERKHGVSGNWYPYTNGRNTSYALDSSAPKHSGRSQRIVVKSDDEAYAGIAQKTSLKGPIDYEVKLVARASVEIRHFIVEAADLHTGEVIGSVKVELKSHNWLSYETKLPISRASSSCEIRLYVPEEHERWADHVSTGMLWFDHISMLPADHVGLVKREVIDMSRDLNAGMMRLAGNYQSAYHWEHGIGPVLERPVMYNEAWGGWTSKYFGTDEFIGFCRELNVEPLICVNDGSGTPEEAAQWVEYCNGGIDTPMGALRAANGHPEPYGVLYWEIGNEVWGPWQVGTCSAEVFAERSVRFAQAMKQADPSIKIMACGHVDQAWNKAVLATAGEHMDYLTLHLYHGYGRFGMTRDTDKEERFKAIVSYPEWTRDQVSRTAQSIKADPKHSGVKIAITEYNTMYFPNTIRKGLPNEHTLEAAVSNAANLNEFLRCSDVVEIGSFSDLVNGWLGGCIRIGDYYADQFRGKQAGWSGRSLTVYATPTYEVMKLYANRDISRLLHAEIECGTFDVKAEKPVRVKLSELPELDAVACTNDAKDTVTIFLVNRSLDEMQIEVSLQAFNGAETAVLYEITGESYESINSVFEPDNIGCTKREIKVSASGKAGFEARPFSIYALEMK